MRKRLIHYKTTRCAAGRRFLYATNKYTNVALETKDINKVTCAVCLREIRISEECKHEAYSKSFDGWYKCKMCNRMFER